MKRIRRLILIGAGLALWTLLLIVGTLLFAEALRVRSMPALERWHREQPASEFTASDARPGFTFDDYLKREQQVFNEVGGFAIDTITAKRSSPILRFIANGPGDPATFTPNWNRTQILKPDGEPIGAALLLHGLSDSPYSMRSTAETLRDAGFECICLRYPGHGTVPAGILFADWEDWFAAAKLAWAHLTTRVGKEKPLIVCGYSTGGALAVLLTLEALERGERAPTRLILFSPAIGITPFAAASNLHRLYSWSAPYEKARWLGIQPEYDPFKYASFPQHAGAESWALTNAVAEAIEHAAASGALAKMPPILAFQSLVDNTIVARELIVRLFDRLPKNGSEIVCFDVNRGQNLEGLMSSSVPDVERFLEDEELPYDFTLLTNEKTGSRRVSALRHASGDKGFLVRELDASWPPQIFSLSHVAIPFPPSDSVYGDGSDSSAGARHDAKSDGNASGAPVAPQVPAVPRLTIGDLSMRGERSTLLISADDLMRLRYNPFHGYMMERVRQAIGSN